MSIGDLFSKLKARGNFGHAGRPGKRGGSLPKGGGGSFDSPAGKVKVGDKVYVQSPLMRNRGQQPVGGLVETTPDTNKMFDVSGRKFHIDDIREVHPNVGNNKALPSNL